MLVVHEYLLSIWHTYMSGCYECKDEQCKYEQRAHILEDWIGCLEAISSHPKDDRYEYLKFIHLTIREFITKNEKIFCDIDAAKSFSLSAPQRHDQLRGQLAERIMPIATDGFLAEYVAEAMLCWTVAGRDFEAIYALLPETIK